MMEFQAVSVSLHCSQPSPSHLPSSSQNLASALSSPSSRRRLFFFHRSKNTPSPLYAGVKFSKLHRSRSCENLKSRVPTVRRALSASFDPLSEDGDKNYGDQRDEIVPANFVIRQKKQRQEGLIQAGETAYCSIKKAFSSTVFIVLELHSFALQMREILFYENLQGIIANVQMEIHASFVWLFQKVFSHTPILMVYIMIFLANYTVYSMSTTAAIAAKSPVEAYATQEASTVEDQKNISVVALSKEEEKLWISVTDDALKMASESRDGVDEDTMQGFVSPVEVRMESDDLSAEYLKTELGYEMELAREPNNSLLLANFAQFLYLVAKDFDRAEEYFKRATKMEPKDSEALHKYGCFLWGVKKDLWGAEEAFLEAIDAEPENPFYPADYAHFLWTTGGEDTCFPLR